MVYYVRVLEVCVTLVYVCVCILSWRGLMGNLYATVCYTCMFGCWAGTDVRIRARPVILSGWGLLCELGRGPLYSVGGAHFVS